MKGDLTEDFLTADYAENIFTTEHTGKDNIFNYE